MSEPTDADIAKARTLLLQASQKKGNELVALLGGPAVLRTINAIATALTEARAEERRRVWAKALEVATVANRDTYAVRSDLIAALETAAALESGDEEGVDDDVLRRRREIMPDYDEKLKRWLS